MATYPQSTGPSYSGALQEHQIDLLLPDSLTRPLWRSLLANLKDRFAPEQLPPLILTSRPIDVGMLLGDQVSLPWFKTVFTNLGNVISPEILPPLELESRPEDIGELISDIASRPWWSSLLRNVADVISPEHVPNLKLTSDPVNASLEAGGVQVVRWSSVISTPKVFYPDKPKPVSQPGVLRPLLPPLATAQPAPLPAHVEASRIQGRLSRSRWREAFLITVAMSEAVYLLVTIFILK